MEISIFSLFCPLEGQKLGQGGQKLNHYEDSMMSVHAKVEDYSEITFPHDIGNHHVKSFCGRWGAKLGQRGRKSKSSPKDYSISIHMKFEYDSMVSFPDNGRKPPSSIVLWTLEDQKRLLMHQCCRSSFKLVKHGLMNVNDIRKD